MHKYLEQSPWILLRINLVASCLIGAVVVYALQDDLGWVMAKLVIGDMNPILVTAGLVAPWVLTLTALTIPRPHHYWRALLSGTGILVIGVVVYFACTWIVYMFLSRH